VTHRSARILGLGTAVPASVEQSRIIDIAVGLIEGTDEQRALLRRIYSRSGVERRGIALEQSEGDLAAFYPANVAPRTSARMRAYERFAPGLAERAVTNALDNARIMPGQITHLITVSCTGFVSPGVDAALIERLGLSRSIKRINIGFMGCHAALNAVEAARSISMTSPDARVLVCCVELCSLHLAYEWEMQRIVSNALFADGAASVVVGQSDDERCWQIVETASFLMPDTKADMGWTIGDDGFKMTLSPHVPMHVQNNIRGWCDAWLGEAGTSVEAIDHWAIHPGGPKVLCGAAEGLRIEPAKLSVSRDVLRNHGNMSSGTVLFILERLRDSSGQCVSLAFGPGLVMEGVLLRRGG
jgi:predicted naringenin-chalcone synthase